MTHIRLFFSIVTWALLARLYGLSRRFCRWYEARTPLVVLGGGNEWPVKHEYGSFKFWDNPSDAAFDIPPVAPSNLKPEDRKAI